jgi:capsular polysaccharide transport system permease protein
MADQKKDQGMFFPRTTQSQPGENASAGATEVAPPLDGTRGFRASSGSTTADPIAPDRVAPGAPASEPVDNRGAWPENRQISFPRRRLRSSRIFQGWFIVSFLAPLILATVYLFLFAPDQFTTEFRFSVRQPVAQQRSGSVSLLSGGNSGASEDMRDNYTVVDFVSSPQAAFEVGAKADLKTIFNRASDPFSRVGDAPNREQMAKFWHSMVDSDYDPASGLAVVRVRAFTAADSYAIANILLSQSSDLINGIGQQSQQDSLRFARAEVDRANADVAALRTQLNGLRRRSGAVDPVANQLNGEVQIADQLKLKLSQTEGQIAVLMQQLRNPNAPQVVLLRQQAAATRGEIQRIQSSIASTGSADIVSAVGQFEDLNTRVANAVRILQDNANRLNEVQTQANAQRLYLATYVKPSLPESPTRPQRLLDLLLVILVAGTVFLIGVLLGKSVMEHAR